MHYFKAENRLGSTHSRSACNPSIISFQIKGNHTAPHQIPAATQQLLFIHSRLDTFFPNAYLTW